MSSNDNSTAFVGSDRSASSPSPSPSMLVHSSAPSPQIESVAKRVRFAKENVAELSIDEVAIIFSFLPPKAIMLARVCTTWRDAAKKTIVPLTDFAVRDATSYNAMRAMSTALPQLQQLQICYLGRRHKYSDGEDAYELIWPEPEDTSTGYYDDEDPDEQGAEDNDTYHTHDINIISNFSMLRMLELYEAPLDGRYHVLFNFPLLEELIIYDCDYLKWDLDMLSGCPLLKVLVCGSGFDSLYLTGNLSSLRALKNTLEKVIISDRNDLICNFMDIADFPRLRKLDLRRTRVTGDIRDIRIDDFPAIESLSLPSSVVGGDEYEFQRISDVPIFIQTILPLVRRSPSVIKDWNGYRDWCWMLSRNSPDWYDHDSDSDFEFFEEEPPDPPPPFRVEFVKAGSRLGWSWCGGSSFNQKFYCEVNWLDPEPRSDSNDYETYIEELQDIDRRVDLYRGYHQPPTEQEYRRLCEE